MHASLRTRSISNGIAALLLAVPAIVVAPRAASPADRSVLTARQVIARIQKHVGVPWREETVDTFKAGDPDTPVTGVAVTMMATQDVLERAAAAGKNLVITHEPTFYGHFDKPDDLEKARDSVLAAKRAFIEKHRMVVWRFHDHWHARTPDGILAGIVRALGWEKHQRPDNQYLFVVPETTLERLAADLKGRLGIRTLRAVGDPSLKLTKVALALGASGSAAEMWALQRDDVEALVIGETREWETVEYVADAVTMGKRKGLILLGHIPSEQSGMEECARWLETFMGEVPIEFVPAVEPFWTPR